MARLSQRLRLWRGTESSRTGRESTDSDRQGVDRSRGSPYEPRPGAPGHLHREIPVGQLGAEKHVVSVNLQLATPGATLELHSSSDKPSDTGTFALASSEGDVLKVNGVDFPRVGDVKENTGTNVLLNGMPDPAVRYLVVWIPKLPSVGNGKYQEGIQEITVSVQ